jgi:HD-like signal output (HDOD) protein
MLAKKIAMDKKKRALADVVFTGGIIHDVGKTILALFVANTFKEILALTQEKQIAFNAAEREIMGFDHQEIGEKVLEKWQFPEVLRAIVRYHHEPMSAPQPFREAASIIHVANTIALMAGVGIGSDGLYHILDENAVKIAGLSGPELEELYGNVPEILKQAKNLL